ncbi:LysM peptidoglycan-binding domain-containing protein [Siphonobacter aquaeclarae]|uniref:LysM domain-containing protein n=1 Tax=Siphonobacter aquaeclarae TaxID=563176 RepID=A0A1G9VES7_9BACT|nr:LysM peptidoglycan-binding domain-containing protein [Siphonobacter aquaeclarae]SDM70616.1 LysM domain-containing protein [Siphonobacter aquaeclarae]
MEDQRNKGGSSLPVITLGVLVIVVLALLYIGYSYFMDDDAVTLTPQRVETSAVTDTESTQSNDVPTPAPVEPEVIGGNNEAKPDGTTAAADTSAKRKEPKKEEKKEEKKTSVSVSGGSVSHKVQQGQTFYSIASKYGMSESRLKEANPGVDPTKISSGSNLKIPVYAVHTVGQGDILRVVAQKYGVTVEAIMKANGKTKNYAERGEKLIIPYPKK